MDPPTPAPTPAQPAAPRSRQLRTWHWIIIAVTACVLLLIAARGFVAWRQHAATSVWQAEGYPLSADDLWAFRGQRNAPAADLYARAFHEAERVAWPEDDFRLLPFVNEWPPRRVSRSSRPTEIPPRDEQLALAQQFLDDHAEVRRLLYAAAQAGPAAMPYTQETYWSPAGAPILYLRNLQRAVELLSLEAMLHADRGEHEAALQSLIVAAHAVELLRDEVTLVEAVTYDALLLAWAGVVQRVLNQTPATDAQLVHLDEIAARLSPPIDWAGAVVPAEAAFGLDEIAARYPANARFARVLGLADTVRTRYLLDMWTCRRHLDIDDDVQRLAALRTLDNQPLPLWLETLDPDYQRPRFGRALVHRYRSVAKIRAMRAALAAQRYRLAHGRTPHALQALVPAYLDAVPRDPFTGHPLRYSRILPNARAQSPNAFVVYSLNDNLHDAGGDDAPSQHNQGRDDIAFHFRHTSPTPPPHTTDTD